MRGRYDPELYELTHRGNAGDVEFYAELGRGSNSALELGCGAGRIALELASSGVRVVGVDNHPGMLALLEERARERRIRIPESFRPVLGDFARLDIEDRFERVLIPYNALYCMLSEEALIGCLRSAAARLTTGGLLAFDVYRVPPEIFEHGDEEEENEGLSHVVTAISSRGVVEVHERPLSHPDPRRLDVEYVYRWGEESRCRRCAGGGGPAEARHAIPQRCFCEAEIPLLLERAGLEPVSVGADFTDAPIGEETGQIVVVARAVVQ